MSFAKDFPIVCVAVQPGVWIPISKPRGWPDVITVFLHSLTLNWEGKLIAVIVSGYDGDGAESLCDI